MSNVSKKVLNPAVFLSIYLVMVLATYVLPYFGSNSWSIASISRQTGSPIGLFYVWFSMHTLTYVVMAGLAYFAGKETNKLWLIAFPIMGAIFDLAPTINMIPLVASVLNIVGLVLCFKAVTSIQESAPSLRSAEFDQAS